MTNIGQEVELRIEGRRAPAKVVEVHRDGTLVLACGSLRVVVHPSAIRRDVRLHPRRNGRRRARAEAYRSCGLVRTPYGWE